MIKTGRYRFNLFDRNVRPLRLEAPVPHLTRTEWELLEALGGRPGKLVTQRSLLQREWGPGCEDQTRDLRRYIAHRRRRLEGNPARTRHLLTEPGTGLPVHPMTISDLLDARKG